MNENTLVRTVPKTRPEIGQSDGLTMLTVRTSKILWTFVQRNIPLNVGRFRQCPDLDAQFSDRPKGSQRTRPTVQIVNILT